jgi:hypothetical protein
MRINGLENSLHFGVSVFDQTHERRHRAGITFENLLYSIACHPPILQFSFNRGERIKSFFHFYVFFAVTVFYFCIADVKDAG